MENKEEMNNVNDEQSELSYQKKPKNNFKNTGYKDKVCKVMKYDKYNKILDIMFDCYGIRILNVENFSGDSVTVKYKNEIGNPDFEYKL